VPAELLIPDANDLAQLKREVMAKIWKPAGEFQTGVVVPVEIDGRSLLGLIYLAEPNAK